MLLEAKEFYFSLNSIDSHQKADDRVINCKWQDVNLLLGRIHRRTYLKEHHKFSYVDPKSNHCSSVFRSLLRTEEAIRYFCNSFNSDYEHTILLFKNRLFRVGYKRSFIDKNLLTYEECVNLKLTRDEREFKNGGDLNSVMLVIHFDKFCRVDKRVRC